MLEHRHTGNDIRRNRDGCRIDIDDAGLSGQYRYLGGHRLYGDQFVAASAQISANSAPPVQGWHIILFFQTCGWASGNWATNNAGGRQAREDKCQDMALVIQAALLMLFVPHCNDMEQIMKSNNEIKVWDIVVRLFHWGTVILCILNLFILEEGERNHRYVGYTLSGLLLIRIVWGFSGSHYAKFSQWFPTPARVIGYLQATLKGQHPYYVGHNPVGSLMIMLLLTCLVGTVVTGILTNYEELFGEDVMEEIHGWFANTLQIAIFIHVIAVITIDHLTHGDLIRAMITGKKRQPMNVDVFDKENIDKP